MHISHSSGRCLFKQSDRSQWSSTSPSKKHKKKNPKKACFLFSPSLICCPKERQVHSSVCQLSFCLISGSLAVRPWIEIQSVHWQHCWVSQRPSIWSAWSKSQRRGTHLIYMKHVVATDFKGASPLLQQGHLYRNPLSERASYTLSYLSGHLGDKYTAASEWTDSS